MALSIGDKLGHYEIMGGIGKGGMGEVYRAMDARLNRIVAIKVSNANFSERFEREAKVIASLNHPNICTLFDVGPNYLVMEYIEGDSPKGPLPLDTALDYAKQIAAALEEAHSKGVTHRDLKPANIKVTPTGMVKVLDFGLAKVGRTTVQDSENSPTLSMSMTEAGMILGTAAYMAPEQARGIPVDHRADIWAFGVVLHEMLTGKRLFQGSDVGEILASVIKEAPAWEGIPAKAKLLLESCLEKDPNKRLRHIGDAWRLVEAVRPVEVIAAPVAKPRSMWAAWAVAGAVTAALAVLGWTHFRETPPPVQNFRFQLTRPNGRGFAFLQLSPDGRYLAYSATGDSLYVRALDSLEEREFPGTDGTTYPFFSPDSTRIGFFSQGKLKQVAVTGGPATNIADVPDARGGAWGPDGTIIFAPSVNGGLFRVSAQGGPATPLKLPTPEGASLRFPVFLPDSESFFYVLGVAGPEAGVYMGSLGGAPPVRILPDNSVTRFVPDPGSKTVGHLFFRRDTTLMAQPFDAEKRETTGEAFPLADPVSVLGNTGYAGFAVAPNGTLLFSSIDIGREREIAWVDRSGKHGKSLLKQPGIVGLALSPDESQVVYSFGNGNTPGDLWLHDVEHGASQRFTLGTTKAMNPRWFPDGGSVLFASFGQVSDLFRKSTKTSVQEEKLEARGTNLDPTSVTADGKLLAYSTTGVGTQEDLWLLPLDGDRKPKVFKQTPFAESQGKISPDGRWMVYVSDSSGRSEIYIEAMPSGGAPRQISVDGGDYPAWRSDGRELYFLSGTKLMAADVKPGPDLTFGTPHELFTDPKIFSLAQSQFVYPSRDGSKFLLLLSVGDVGAPPLTVVTNWRAAFGK